MGGDQIPFESSPIICLQSSSSLQKVGLRHSDQLWSYGLSMAKKRAWHHHTPESLWLRLGEGGGPVLGEREAESEAEGRPATEWR